MRSHRSLLRMSVLAAAILGLLVWVYTLNIAPLRRREGELLEKVAEMSQRIDATRRAVQEIKQKEQASARARAKLRSFDQDVPSGAAISWFPTLMRQHFDRLGIADSVTRLNTALDEPRIPDCQRTYWAVDLPFVDDRRGMRNLLIAR